MGSEEYTVCERWTVSVLLPQEVPGPEECSRVYQYQPKMHCDDNGPGPARLRFWFPGAGGLFEERLRGCSGVVEIGIHLCFWVRASTSTSLPGEEGSLRNSEMERMEF